MTLRTKTIIEFTFLLLAILMPVIAVSAEADSAPSESQSEVISAFTNDVVKDVQSEETKFRHKLLFAMGVLLLIFIFTTAYFGLSMALFDKQVFVPHMIFAGGTVFLAVAHAVVAIVWFFPF